MRMLYCMAPFKVASDSIVESIIMLVQWVNVLRTQTIIAVDLVESNQCRRPFKLNIVRCDGACVDHGERNGAVVRTRLVQAGVDLYKVQRLLGHKLPTMTQRYAQHYPESLRDGVEVLDRKGRISTN